VYSSGAGIALGLIIRRFLGISREASVLRVDPVIPATLNGLRVESTLLGRTVELNYQIKGPGCGVNLVTLNDIALPFATEPNPHRRGAALVALTAVEQALKPRDNVLKISIG
jgi:cellobiose phosphorylase